MKEPRSVPFDFQRRSEADMLKSAESYFSLMKQRKSVRLFSSDPVPKELIKIAIETAATAPSGANKQPWRFVAVGDSETKKRIRIAAEKEEKLSYTSRMPEEWLEALKPMGTNWIKGYLEKVPWLVVVFAVSYDLENEEVRRKNYYVQESVGIACGLFVSAIHNMGLATLTHTPSPMGFLAQILGRPKNERPFLLFPVGYPAQEATVPDIQHKDVEDVLVWFE